MTSDAARLFLLGAPHVRRGEQRFDLPDAMPGYLVACLAVRGDWMLREELAVLLWPEATGPEAQNNLRVNLTRLRPHLGRWGLDAAFVAERRRLRLDVDTDVNGLRVSFARGEWPAAAESMRGQFLDGMSFRAFPVLGEWAQSQREVLRSLWREAVLRSGEAASPAERLDRALGYLAVDPFDEEVARTQIDALAQLGRGAEIARVMAEFDARARSELGVGASPALTDFARRLSGDRSRPAGARDSDDPLIGRAADVAGLARHCLASPLVSLVGLGGSGKTRVARATLDDIAPHFADGAIWLSLIDASSVLEVTRRFGERLQIVWRAGVDPVEQLAAHVGQRALLLVLDNAEPLLKERAELLALLSHLQQHCPRLRCLVTSREPLQHPAEVMVRLDGLAVPADGSGLEALSTAAVDLYVRQARRHDPNFDPRGAVGDLVSIARLTGGLPLALRIAAAWMRFLSCADVAAEIRRGLNALEPHADMASGVRATLARTWTRLSPAEQGSLARLSVFVSPFTAQAAREVGDAALPILGNLVERCLLARLDATPPGERTRFEMHPLVRAYAAERLALDRAQRHAALDQHARHVERLVAPWVDIRRVDQKKALEFVAALLPEILAAWHWALGAGRTDYVALVARVLGYFHAYKGRWSEPIALFTDAARHLDPQRRTDCGALVEVGRAHAGMLDRIGDYVGAEHMARRTLELARSIGHAMGIKGSLNTLGLALMIQGRHAEALAPFEEAREIARAEEDRVNELLVAGNIAILRHYVGDFAGAEALWNEVLEARTRNGDAQGAVNVLVNLGSHLRQQQRLVEARGHLDEALRLCDEHGFVSIRPMVLVNLAHVHFSAGRTDAAATLADVALAAARASGERRAETAALLLVGEVAMSSDRPRDAAAFLRQALAIARAGGDLPNQLAALELHARWCVARGRDEEALVISVTVLDHPRVDALAAHTIRARWMVEPPAARALESARAAARRTDIVALVERATAEWDSVR